MLERMFGNILRNVYSPECLVIFPGIFEDILRNVWGHSPECLGTFPGMFSDSPRNLTFPQSPRFPHSVAHSWGHSPECLATFLGI